MKKSELLWDFEECLNFEEKEKCKRVQQKNIDHERYDDPSSTFISVSNYL